MFKIMQRRFQDKTKDSLNHIGSLKTLLWYRLGNYFRKRDINQEVFKDNFLLVLEEWGLEEEQIPSVCSDLKCRLLVFVLTFIIGLILFVQEVYFHSAMVGLCSILGISTTYWRICILENKIFISYGQYLYRCLFCFTFFKKFFKG